MGWNMPARARMVAGLIPAAIWSGEGVLFLPVVALGSYLPFAIPGSAEAPLMAGAANAGVATLAAAFCCLAAWHVHSSRERWSWLLLGLGCLAGALAAGLWYGHLYATGEELASPSLADVAWAVFYLASFLGLVLQAPREGGRWKGLDTLADALLLALAMGALSWELVQEPLLAGSPDLATGLVNLSWPLGDLLVIFALLSLILRQDGRRLPRHTLWLLAAFLVELAADTAYCVLLVRGGYQTGNLADLVWPLAYALCGLAALVRLRSPAETKAAPEPGADSRWRQRVLLFLPYLSLPIMAAAIYAHLEHLPVTPVGDPYVIAGIGSFVAGVLFFRQFLLVLGMARQAERMAALNSFAMRLGQCQSSEDTLAIGLEFGRQTSGQPTGAVWLRGADDSLQMAAAQTEQRGSRMGDARQGGVASPSLRTLADLPSLWPALRAALGSDAPACLAAPRITLGSAEGLAHLIGKRVIAIPLVSRGVVLGGMVLMGGETGWCEGEGEHDLARAIGRQIGVALENARRYEDVKYIADRDPVTALLNHRALHLRLERELKRAEGSGWPLSLVIMDVDSFKRFNDTYGHPAGDQVLRLVARMLTETCRSSDTIGRYGGDEFVAILPGAGSKGAISFAERLRGALARQPHLVEDGRAVPIHISFGIAAYPTDGGKSHDLVRVADARMYASKRRGGDTITADSFGDEEPQAAKSAPFAGAFGAR